MPSIEKAACPCKEIEGTIKENGSEEGDKVIFISSSEAARRLGVSAVTVSRVSRKHGVGVFVEGGRFAALDVRELGRLRSLIRATPGNPDWIAATGTGKRKRSRPKSASRGSPLPARRSPAGSPGGVGSSSPASAARPAGPQLDRFPARGCRARLPRAGRMRYRQAARSAADRQTQRTSAGGPGREPSRQGRSSGTARRTCPPALGGGSW